jgi:hypothetical protein
MPFESGKARVQPELCTGTVLVQDNSRNHTGLAHDDSRTDNGSICDDSYTDNESVQEDSLTGNGLVQDEYSTDTVPVQRKERKKESKERKKEEKEIKEAPLTPLKGESAGSDYFRYLALQFRKFFPSPKQGTLDSTIACMMKEYPLYEREEIEARMHEHLAAGTKDLAPWELFSREPGQIVSVKKEPRRRNADELDFFDLHGHFPEQADKAASCRICAGEQR